jgi:hypothetical protein
MQPSKSNKHTKSPEYHSFIKTFNLIVASCMALIATEMNVRGLTFMQFDSFLSYGFVHIVQDFIVAVIYESVVEYYWHRLMHLRFGLFYSTDITALIS